jgi:hypothetical protein
MGDSELLPRFVHHYPDTPGLRLNQFVYVNEEKPWEIEAWCTQSPEKGVPGVWDGPRKLRTMKLVDGGVYPEFVLLETNFEKDNTVGVVGPLVCILNGNNGHSVFVEVNPHKNRRGGDVIEAMRQRHGSLDVKPEASDGLSMVITEYGPDVCGLILTNTACIHGETPNGEIRLAIVRGELTIASNIDHLPTLNSPFVWMPLVDYLYLTMDPHGHDVVNRNIHAGYIKRPLVGDVRKVLKRLPAFVAEQTR